MRSVRIHPSRNHLGSLLMMQDHLNNLGCAPYYNGRDRNQPDSKVGYRSHVFLLPHWSFAVRPWSLASRTDQRRPANDQRRFSGGADRDRTGGLLVANQALSQLSYSPNPVVRLWSFVVRKSQRPTTCDQRPIRWWAWVELNYRPHPYQGCALAN